MSTEVSTAPPGQPLHHRKSVAALDAQQLAWLRQAFAAALPIQDDRGYLHFAGLHGLPLPMYCQHNAPPGAFPLFLPWHRACLYFFELALQDQVPTVSLPWWDWSGPEARAGGLPDAYAAARAGDAPNPLFDAPIPEAARRQGARLLHEAPARTSRVPGPPADLPSPEEVQAVLAAPDFLDFSGRLEDLHNRIHVWCGGTLAEIPWAAYDPLFWAHHAMIDRLWRLWQLANREANLDATLLRQALPPFAMTVGDTLDVTALGYDYAVAAAHVIVGGGA